MLATHSQEATIKSTLEVREQTKVTLIGKDYTGIVIVTSCRGDGQSFILTISMGKDQSAGSPSLQRDPGVLAVDSFLTEEEEAKILQDLDDWTASWNVSYPAPVFI